MKTGIERVSGARGIDYIDGLRRHRDGGFGADRGGPFRPALDDCKRCGRFISRGNGKPLRLGFVGQEYVHCSDQCGEIVACKNRIVPGTVERDGKPRTARLFDQERSFHQRGELADMEMGEVTDGNGLRKCFRHGGTGAAR